VSSNSHLYLCGADERFSPTCNSDLITSLELPFLNSNKSVSPADAGRDPSVSVDS
jgi:hypothetical protein